MVCHLNSQKEYASGSYSNPGEAGGVDGHGGSGQIEAAHQAMETSVSTCVMRQPLPIRMKHTEWEYKSNNKTPDLYIPPCQTNTFQSFVQAWSFEHGPSLEGIYSTISQMW